MFRISRAEAAVAWVMARGVQLLGHDIWSLRQNFATEDDIGQDLMAYGVEESQRIGGHETVVASLKKIALSKESSSYDDGKVLEALADVLNRAYGRSTVSAGTLDSIRNALLIPGESDRLSVEMEKIEAVCAGCAHQFTDGEVTVYRTEATRLERRGMVSPTRKILYCTKCVQPRWMACHHAECNQPVDIPQKVISVFHNANQLCKDHQEKNRAEWIAKKKSLGKESQETLPDANPFGTGPVVAANPAMIPPRYRGLAQRLRAVPIPPINPPWNAGEAANFLATNPLAGEDDEDDGGDNA